MPKSASILDTITRSEPSLPVQQQTGSTTAEVSGDPQMENLPPEFWESRVYLTKIRDAAWSRLISPDAVLGAVLARVATKIPVSYVIPPIIASQATFDHLSVLVGDSSSGKSAAAAIAAELLPENNEKGIVWDLPSPSGEGLIDAFFTMEPEDPGDKANKKKVKTQSNHAVMFTLDEGMALIQQGQRSGTTIHSVLCSAWAGTTIGQANASDDRKRVIKKGKARVAGLMGIQTSLGHNFLTDGLVEQGLAGRIVWFAAEDPSMPFDGPEFPEKITIPGMDIIGITTIEYPKAIRHEIRWDHHQVRTKQAHEDPIDGHTRLAKLKIAGMFALIEGRRNVTLDDWNLATSVLTASTAIRDRMKKIGGEKRMEAIVTQGTAQGTREIAAQTFKTNALITEGMVHVTDAIDEYGPIQKKALKNKISSRFRKSDVLNPILDAIVDSGRYSKTDEGYK